VVPVFLLHGGGKRGVRPRLSPSHQARRQSHTAEPERTAQQLVNRGFTEQYDYALETLRDIPYAQWREFDPEDSLRFFGLRLHEAGMIESSPNRLIAAGTNWRFLNELKRELKA
jgi:NitT/TauT family transport system substrate-binding protein